MKHSRHALRYVDLHPEVDALLAQIDTFEADAKGEFGAGFLTYHYFVTLEA